MHYACGSGSVSIYNYIYNLSPQSANVKTEDMNETPLHWAVASNNLEVTKLLTIAYLQNGWDIDQKNLVLNYQYIWSKYYLEWGDSVVPSKH